ncbi:nonstructural protein [Maize rough dwarf virus]|uniref:Nonstructural protein n=1 Tax=Maize rough dwarf virus TaxID=10989 RepID=A0A0R4TEC6_MRDV|nr:nonstructural protein [Maize rough dwarf virus]AEA35036.1 nonstructural protein [Maize rough dwarf virus]
MTKFPLVSQKSKTECSHQRKCVCLILSETLADWELTTTTVTCQMLSHQERNCITIIPVRFDSEISDILSLVNILDVRHVATITELASNFPCVNWDTMRQQLKRYDPTQLLVNLEQNFNHLQRDDRLRFNSCYNYPNSHILNRILNTKKDVIPFIFKYHDDFNSKIMSEISVNGSSAYFQHVFEKTNIVKTLLFGSTLGVMLHL